MREIKFRYMFHDDDYWQYLKFPNDLYGENYYDKEFKLRYFSQYTGLKDKNGKEIYEGDIVKSISDLPAYIKFGEYSAGGTDYYASKAYGFYVQRIEEGKEYKDETETLGSYHEVLGNIYENPELLAN